MLCDRLGLAKGRNVAETVDKAVQELGVWLDRDRSMAEKVDACLQQMSGMSGPTGMGAPSLDNFDAAADPAALRAQLEKMLASNAQLHRRLEQQDRFLTDVMARVGSGMPTPGMGHPPGMGQPSAMGQPPGMGQPPAGGGYQRATDPAQGGGIGTAAAVQLMITNRMRSKLTELGYSHLEIDRMPPDQAAEVINNGTPPGQADLRNTSPPGAATGSGYRYSSATGGGSAGGGQEGAGYSYGGRAGEGGAYGASDGGYGGGARAGGSGSNGIDDDRRNRSPGLYNNFYDAPTADFKQPYTPGRGPPSTNAPGGGGGYGGTGGYDGAGGGYSGATGGYGGAASYGGATGYGPTPGPTPGPSPGGGGGSYGGINGLGGTGGQSMGSQSGGPGGGYGFGGGPSSGYGGSPSSYDSEASGAPRGAMARIKARLAAREAQQAQQVVPTASQSEAAAAAQSGDDAPTPVASVEDAAKAAWLAKQSK